MRWKPIMRVSSFSSERNHDEKSHSSEHPPHWYFRLCSGQGNAETKLEVSAKAIQNTQAAYEKCKKIYPEEKCKSILNALETEKEVRNKLCRDNKVPSGSYGCP